MNTLKTLLLSVLLVFAPIKAALITAGILIAVDLITGIMAARKRGEAITSSGLRRTVTKMLVYESVIMLAFLVETYLTGPMVPLAKIAAGFVGVTELKSCMENMNELSGMNLLKALIAKLGSDNQQNP